MSAESPVRPRAGARERILDTAFRLFYARGIRAVGVDKIIADSNVAKATLYKHFPAKDDLAVAYLDRVDEVWTGQLHEAADAAGPLPADRMVGAFDALVNACRRDGYRGCAFINAAAEALPDTPVHNRTVQHKTRVREWFRELAAEAGARDPETLAQQLSLVLDGGLSAGALDGDPRAAETARATARVLVDNAVAEQSAGGDGGPGGPAARDDV